MEPGNQPNRSSWFKGTCVSDDGCCRLYQGHQSSCIYHAHSLIREKALRSREPKPRLSSLQISTGRQAQALARRQLARRRDCIKLWSWIWRCTGRSSREGEAFQQAQSC
ncbi:hypothetical protein BS78_04G044800 [Paspalum vaginatum]|nr:hypothetical protein BS78_04G044800 [Paspalum vaginatum]